MSEETSELTHREPPRTGTPPCTYHLDSGATGTRPPPIPRTRGVKLNTEPLVDPSTTGVWFRPANGLGKVLARDHG